MPSLEESLASLAESLEILSSRMRTGMDDHERPAGGKAPSMGAAVLDALFGPTSVMTPDTPMGTFARRNYQLAGRTRHAMKPFRERLRKSGTARLASKYGKRAFDWAAGTKVGRTAASAYDTARDSGVGRFLFGDRTPPPATPAGGSGGGSAGSPGGPGGGGVVHVWVDGPFPFPGSGGPPPAAGATGGPSGLADAMRAASDPHYAAGRRVADVLGAPLPPGGTPVVPPGGAPPAPPPEPPGPMAAARAEGLGAVGTAGAAVGAGATFGAAVYEFGKHVYDFAKGQEQEIRRLAEAGGGKQAEGVALLDMERTLRDLKKADATGDSSLQLTKSLSNFEEKLLPIQEALENLANQIGSALLDVLSKILELLTPLFELLGQIFDVLAGILKKLTFGLVDMTRKPPDTTPAGAAEILASVAAAAAGVRPWP